MKLTVFSKRLLRYRREKRAMERAGYAVSEMDWRLHRGALMSHKIEDVKIAADGRHVYYKVSEKPVSDW